MTHDQKSLWAEIRRVALELGASSWAIYKWRDRGAVPPEWQIRIFKHTEGAITLEQMGEPAPARAVTPATMDAARYEEELESSAPQALP
jgi:hypothetical protein